MFRFELNRRERKEKGLILCALGASLASLAVEREAGEFAGQGNCHTTRKMPGLPKQSPLAKLTCKKISRLIEDKEIQSTGEEETWNSI
jgi:hypothetical protein